MTLEKASTVLALLQEEPLLRVYAYVHALTGQTLYACFPYGQDDDMREAPCVTEARLLFDHGIPTVEGERWQREMEERQE